MHLLMCEDPSDETHVSLVREYASQIAMTNAFMLPGESLRAAAAHRSIALNTVRRWSCALVRTRCDSRDYTWTEKSAVREANGAALAPFERSRLGWAYPGRQQAIV